MKNLSRLFRIVLTYVLLAASNSYADPSKTMIQIVVPTAAEGSTDQLARILGAGIRNRGLANVEVVNMPGNSGAIAANFVANAKPDGRTLLIATPSSHSIAKALSVANKTSLSYDPVASFSIISCFAKAPYIFVVSGDGQKSFGAFVNEARKSNSTIKYSSTGVGGPHHLIAEYLFNTLDLKVQHVPAAGGAKAIEMVNKNQVAAMMPASILAIPQIQSGQIQALAITGEQHLGVLPKVPTFKELNISLYLESWYGLMGPSGLAQKQVDDLANIIQLIMQDPLTKKKVESLGINVVDIRDKAFVQMIEQETAIWQAVAKSTMTTN